MGNKGCVMITGANKVLVELSTFFNSKTSSSGAVIYVRNGNSIISKVCCSNCVGSSEYGKAVCYILVNDTLGAINKFIDSSVHDCSYYILGTPIALMNGQILFKTMNVTQNKCIIISGVSMGPSDDANGIASRMQFCSIFNNTQSRNFINLPSSCVTEMTYSNILENKQTRDFSNSGLITAGNVVIMRNVSIIGNTGGKPFYNSKSYYELIYCTLKDDYINNVDSDQLKTDEIEPVYGEFIHYFNFISTDDCYSEWSLDDVISYYFPKSKANCSPDLNCILSFSETKHILSIMLFTTTLL